MPENDPSPAAGLIDSVEQHKREMKSTTILINSDGHLTTGVVALRDVPFIDSASPSRFDPELGVVLKPEVIAGHSSSPQSVEPTNAGFDDPIMIGWNTIPITSRTRLL